MSADDLETLGKGNGHEPTPPPAATSRKGEVVIRLDKVSKGFGSGQKRIEPVKRLSLDVERGTTLVIIGPSGTGKSVTLRLMLGLLDPDEGEVYAFGQKLSAMSNQELGGMRRRMAMLFQGGALFDSMTVGENVAFPMRSMGERDEDKIMSIVSERLRQVGLPGTEDKMPSELSGGMKKRAALARSIATRPEVILYDEPTTGLDPIMSDAIADLILETHESLKDTDVTSIVVTHDMHVAEKVADRIIMLYGGSIVGDGPPELYRSLGQGSLPDNATEMDRMIRQFVRGEADGPIQTVA
ncbi:MAG: ATP-binding cassette domain-containing protein [Planctomycetaceae bacterium]|nr:ATP-binding cassette domain-containing protein [Planctomycetaceae bacterium]